MISPVSVIGLVLLAHAVPQPPDHVGLPQVGDNVTLSPSRPSGNLRLAHFIRRESVKVNIYNADGSYNVRALKAVSHFLRCPRTNLEKGVDPRLLAILSQVYDHFGNRPILVTSGYRYQRNTSSFHYRGTATDIFVRGVSPASLLAYVESLDSGHMGIGFYPRRGFVHVDVRPRSARWVDNSLVATADPGRRPPPGWQKKRLVDGHRRWKAPRGRSVATK